MTVHCELLNAVVAVCEKEVWFCSEVGISFSDDAIAAVERVTEAVAKIMLAPYLNTVETRTDFR